MDIISVSCMLTNQSPSCDEILSLQMPYADDFLEFCGNVCPHDESAQIEV